jgi:hypothetical protein
LNPDPTYPHDYRIIAGSEAKPTIVGGQAVNLWAITFLEPGDPHLTTKYASGDLDVLSTPKILNFLKSLEPAWRVDKIPFWAFGDGRDLDQVGPPERHDRSHLQLVTRFFPLYLRHIHRSAIENPATQNAAAGVFSRAFETLTNGSFQSCNQSHNLIRARNTLARIQHPPSPRSVSPSTSSGLELAGTAQGYKGQGQRPLSKASFTSREAIFGI